jgi:outer membrane lipoprotein LolB
MLPQPATNEALAPLGPAVESFSLTGRIALRQGSRSDHLRFDWEHAPDSDRLLLTTPLGQGIARVQRDARGASLDTADGQRRVAASWKLLTHEVFGVELPLDDLPEWLRGARPYYHGEVAGWTVAVTEVSPSRQRRLLPRVIEVRKGDIELRMVVDERGDGS